MRQTWTVFSHCPITQVFASCHGIEVGHLNWAKQRLPAVVSRIHQLESWAPDQLVMGKMDSQKGSVCFFKEMNVLSYSFSHGRVKLIRESHRKSWYPIASIDLRCPEWWAQNCPSTNISNWQTQEELYIYVYKESDLETTHEKHCEYQNYQNENLVEKTNMWKLFQGFVFSFSSVVWPERPGIISQWLLESESINEQMHTFTHI
jgi:hypothetical protein